MSDEINCTFCGKSHDDKTCLCFIAAPNNTFICDKCVEIARDIVGSCRVDKTKIVYMGNVAKNEVDK